MRSRRPVRSACGAADRRRSTPAGSRWLGPRSGCAVSDQPTHDVLGTMNDREVHVASTGVPDPDRVQVVSRGGRDDPARLLHSGSDGSELPMAQRDDGGAGGSATSPTSGSGDSTVALGRKLVPYKPGDDPAAVSPWLLLRDAVPWDDVLDHGITVILGEAGSGKTTEFRQQAARLAADGRYAFGLTVEELDRDGIPGGLRAADLERFEAWKASDQTALFFVDSIDEARLSNDKLERALKQLARGLYAHLRRVRVLLSCRVSDWRPDADVATLTRELRPPTVDKVEVHVYSLAPLVLEQVEALAAHLGVADPKAFSKAAEDAGVEPFLRRPGDVTSMARYWSAHRRFGSLTEMVEADLSEKLRERNANRSPKLTPQRARAAAQAVAGLAWLQGASAFELIDGGLELRPDERALDVARVCPDLGKDELRDLLTRPLFDEATYGRVRIHHRSVSEYLTAQWLGELVARGLARSEVEGLLFWPGPEGPIVPARWVAIAAWMAGTDAVIARRLIEAEPVAFLQAGDPSRLSAATREEIVDALVARYGGRGRLPSMTDGNTLRRFARGCPEARVKAHLDTVESEGLLTILLEIAREGRMASCVDAALRIACAKGARRPRWEAIELVVEVGDRAQVEAMLRALIEDVDAIEHEVGGALVFHGYPRCISVERLLVLLARVEGPPEQTGTILEHDLGGRVVRDTSRADRVRLLDGVLALAQDPAKPRAIRAGKRWLVEALAGMLATWGKDLADHEVPLLEPHLRFFTGLSHYGHLSHELGESDLRQLLDGDARVRRLLFWWDVGRVRAQGGKHRPITRLWDVDPEHRLWNLTDADTAWLAEDALGRPAPADRMLAFDALRSVPTTESQAVVREALVRKVAAGDEALGKHLERSMRGWVPPRHSKYERLIKRSEARRARRERENREALSPRLAGIRAGTDHHALGWLAHKVVGPKEDAPPKAIEALGAEIVSAAREGLARMWRTVPCPLDHEPGDHDLAHVAALGLELAVEGGLDFESLDEATAELAARHAAVRLNGRPPWIERLVSAHPAAVARTFEACIDVEYKVAPGERRPYRVLSHLSHEPMAVRHLCRPMVLSRLLTEEPVRIETLDDALEAIIASGEPLVDLAPLAPTRFAAAAAELPRRALWWCAWLAADAEGATAALEAELADGGPASDATMLAFCDRLWRFVEVVRTFPKLTDVPVLGRLVALVFAHIRPAEDVLRIGAYSPGPRHNAESVRDWWLRALKEAPGPGAYLELRRVADLPQCAAWRDSILMDADVRLGELATGADSHFARRVLATYERHGLGALDHTAYMGPSLEALRDLRGPLDHLQLFDVLCTLVPTDLDRVILTSGLDPALLPPPLATVTDRARGVAERVQHDPAGRTAVTAALAALTSSP